MYAVQWNHVRWHYCTERGLRVCELRSRERELGLVDAIHRESRSAKPRRIAELQRDDAAGAVRLLFPALQKRQRLSAADLNMQGGVPPNQEQSVSSGLGQRDDFYAKS